LEQLDAYLFLYDFILFMCLTFVINWYN
jgi:hypothetical protein